MTFDFAAEDADRVANFCVLAGSVGENRPNRIVVTTSAGDQVFENPLGSFDGLLFDAICLPVDIPAGDTMLTAQLFSVVSEDPLGASMGWIGTGLSVPVTPPPELACLGDFVWHDMDMDGIQDDGEAGIEGVTVHLMDCEGQTLAETMTDVDGYYMFCELEPGDYNVHFVLPDGYVFSPMDQGADDAMDSDADPATGLTMCTTLEPGENDMTWDAGMHMPPQDGCSYTIGKWKNWTGLGPQPDLVSPLLPIMLGDAGGAKSLDVVDVGMAVDLLSQHVYGNPGNGITKLYAQMLGSKLNVANGASDADIADTLAAADAFLADHDHTDWKGLSKADQMMVLDWKSMFDAYNNGLIGPGHCDETFSVEFE